MTPRSMRDGRREEVALQQRRGREAVGAAVVRERGGEVQGHGGADAGVDGGRDDDAEAGCRGELRDVARRR